MRSHASMMRCRSSSVNGALLANRLAPMGGLISGYDYGKWGIGHDHKLGPVLAPLIMAEYGRIGANIILIPPIPSSDLPFTIGFQLRVRFW